MFPTHGGLEAIVDFAKVFTFDVVDFPGTGFSVEAGDDILVAEVIAQATTQRKVKVILFLHKQIHLLINLLFAYHIHKN